MLSIAWALLPDFVLILLGLSLRRWFGYPAEFWGHLERLVYYVMFPALLFRSVVKSELEFTPALDMIAAGVGFTAGGLACGLLLCWWLRPSSQAFASTIQTAFRFNTYIGIAVVDRLAGGPGIAALALLVGVLVPAVNALAVWFLARHGGHSVWREILRNPLIIATVSGFICKLLGVTAPDTAMHLIDLFAVAATPLGLLAVGAGLRSEGLRQNLALINGMTAIKLVVVPALAWGLAEWFDLSGMYRTAAIVLATLPTASSAYILAVRMGGDGKLVASIITMNIFVGMLTLPFWLTFTL